MSEDHQPVLLPIRNTLDEVTVDHQLQKNLQIIVHHQLLKMLILKKLIAKVTVVHLHVDLAIYYYISISDCLHSKYSYLTAVQAHTDFANNKCVNDCLH